MFAPTPSNSYAILTTGRMGRQSEGSVLVGRRWSCKLHATMLACQGCSTQEIVSFSYISCVGNSIKSYHVTDVARLENKGASPLACAK